MRVLQGMWAGTSAVQIINNLERGVVAKLQMIQNHSWQ